MKRFLALLLALVLALGLVGCSEVAQVAGEMLLDVALEALEEGPISTDVPVTQAEPEAEPDPLPEPTPTSTPGPDPAPEPAADPEPTPEPEPAIAEDGWYYSAEDVALYIHTYGYLPGNFITKDEARDLGWEGGSVEDYAEGCAIGGDRFGNREGILPAAKGRTYYECDIDTLGRNSRGAKRIVFSDDGLIYYTDDHYESFTLLYGEE